MQNEKTKKQFAISNNQFVLIIGVFIVLGLVTWVRGSDRIKNIMAEMFKKHEQVAHIPLKDRPEYKKYFQPDNEPEVLGATTAPSKPELVVLGEDGQMHPVNNLGEVLGASTETVDTNLENIHVILSQSNTAQDTQSYLDTSAKLEADILDGAALETALTTHDQGTINQFVVKVDQLENKLQNMVVPKSAERLHKLEILQFRSVRNLLKNFSNIDNNPEQASDDLSIFIRVQSDQGQERQKIQTSL